MFLAIEVCHCASLFCLPGLCEDEDEDDEDAAWWDGILPRRCFSLRVLVDQSRKMRCRPDMLRLFMWEGQGS